MATRIQHRRGTAAQWTAANPILTSGEPGYETDTGVEKTGDGSTLWNDLTSKMRRTNTVQDVQATGQVAVDYGNGIQGRQPLNSSQSNIALDTDGTPYYSPGSVTIKVTQDTDGTPYYQPA